MNDTFLNDVLPSVLGYWLIGTFISGFYIWLKSDEVDPGVRRVGAAIRGATWPYLLIKKLMSLGLSTSGQPNPDAARTTVNPVVDRHEAPSREPRHDYSLLPPDIIRKAAIFGRHDFDPINSPVESSTIWVDTIEPLYRAAQQDRRLFLRQLAGAVVPVGGWAVYGGAHIVKEVVGGDFEDLSHDRLMAASLGFLRECGLPPSTSERVRNCLLEQDA